MNIYLLSQHSLGVGHLSRTSLLAGEIARIPGVSVIHISCGPSTGIVPSQADVLFVELPPLIVKGLSSIELVPVEGGKTKEEVEEERVLIIEALFRRHPPDMFITEFFPFSPHRLDGTVLPVLELIKERHPGCTVVCSRQGYTCLPRRGTPCRKGRVHLFDFRRLLRPAPGPFRPRPPETDRYTEIPGPEAFLPRGLYRLHMRKTEQRLFP